MWIYLTLMLIPVLAYFLLGERGARSEWFLAAYLAVVAAVVGLGDMLGGKDRYIYGFYFDRCADYIRSGEGIMGAIHLGFRTEMGYVVWNWLVAHLTANRYIFILLTTLLIYGLLFQSLRKYTDNYPFALILFMGFCFAFTFTYLRQTLAAAIGFLSVKYVIDRKLWKFLLVVGLAMSFHNSAFILLLLYFIPRRKFSKNATLWVMTLCLLIGMTDFTALLSSSYGDVTADYERMSFYSVQPPRLTYYLEAMFILFFIHWKYDDIREDSPRQLVLMNMALCFCATLLVFIRSDFGGRMSWYFLLGVIATLTRLAVHRSVRDVFIVVSVALLLRVLVLWGDLLVPYKTFLTNDVRGARTDSTEYDHRYVKDRFYR